MFKNKIVQIAAIITFITVAIALPSLVHSNNKLKKLEINPMPIIGSNGYFEKIEMNTTIPEIPTKMKVYKIKDLNLSKEDMSKQMKNLGFSSSEIKENDREFTTVDGNKTLILDKKSGSINYYTQKLTSATKPIKNLLSDEEYKDLAENFLVEKKLMKDEIYFKKVLRHTVGKIGQPEQVCLVEAVFTKDLNEQRFSGVGPKLCVFFGENGEVLGIYSIWKELVDYEYYPIIDTEKAINNVINKNAIIANAGNGDIGSIENCEITYDIESLRSNQKYVIPYYMFRGKNKSGNDFTALTRAIPDEYLNETNLSDIPTKKNYSKDLKKEGILNNDDDDE